MSKAGYDQREINEIANFAFVSGSQNRSISNKAPNVYLPDIINRRGPEALTLQGIPTSPELWAPENFQAFLEYRRADLANVVNAFLDQIATGSGASIDLASLVEGDENDRLEFKETARVNIHTGAVDKAIQHSVVKTIAAFMNSHGGTLVIGINDASKLPVGLDRDLHTLGKRRDLDGYEQFLRQLFNNAFGTEHSTRTTISFPVHDGMQACVVQTARSPRPVWVRDGDSRDLYVRDGNETRRLNSEEAVRYVNEHFPGA